MCMTELHGGVCHRTSTPHKSGNKMKEKKNEMMIYHFSHVEPLTTAGVHMPVSMETLKKCG